jgi:hypothetical protein
MPSAFVTVNCQRLSMCIRFSTAQIFFSIYVITVEPGCNNISLYNTSPRESDFLWYQLQLELGYNDLGFYDTSDIVSDILWYQLIPHEASVLVLHLVRHVRASTSDITTLPVIGANVIFQEA